MDFEQLLDETKYSTSETAKRLQPLFLQTGEYKKIMDRYSFEKEQMKKKYPEITNLVEVMRTELLDYLSKLIPAIKEMYGEYIPNDRMQKLERLLNPENIIVIADAKDKHDFSADSEAGQVIVNLAKLAIREEQDSYDKLVSAKGVLPHEIFHLIIIMLKPEKLADERMTISLFSGEKITSRGMVGFMLNEGLAEKLSLDFCMKQEQFHPGEFYCKIAPQYIPYVNICNYIIRNSQNVPNFFTADYEEFLSTLTADQQLKYKQAECISFAVRHGDVKFGRKIVADEVAYTKVEKISLDGNFDGMTKGELKELKGKLVLSQDYSETQSIDSEFKM